MSRLHRILSSLVCLLFAACAAQEVQTATQVMVRIDSTDSALLAQASTLRVSVSLREGDGWRTPRSVDIAVEGLRWPVDVPVFPRDSGDELKQFDVVVEALAGDQVLAQIRTVTSFAPRQHTVLELTLYLCSGPTPVCSPRECHGAECLVCDERGECVAAGSSSTEPSTTPERDAGSTSETGLDAMVNSMLDGGACVGCGVDAGPGPAASPDAGPAPMADAGPAPAIDAGPCTSNCQTLCSADADCSGGRKCDKASGACVECLQSTDCTGDKPFCSGARACVACLMDSDCKTTGYRCSQNACVPSCSSPADCTSLPGSVCSSATNSCQCQPAAASCAPDGQLRQTDSCGGYGAISKDCCGRGCSGTSCNAPQPHVRSACHNGDVYWLDSCGAATDMIRSCCGEGCANGTCNPVRPQASKVCVGGDSYWADSCGTSGAMAKSCCGAGCSNGECAAINPQATKKCHMGHVYWFDSCGAPTTIATNCGTRDCMNNACRPACPSGMVPVPGLSVCIDAYEASFYTSSSCSGTRYDKPPDGFPWYVTSSGLPASWTDAAGYLRTFVTPSVNLYACSIGNVRPTTNVSYFQAKRACENSNKRLCKDAEWGAACAKRYPYGDTYVANACHNTFGASVANTGSFTQCQGTVTGLYDMVGNVQEWLDCPLNAEVCWHASSLFVDQNVMCSYRQGTTVREPTVYDPGNGMYRPSEEGTRCCVSQ